MGPSKADKAQTSKEVIKEVLGMADDNKSKMSSVKVKIKFDNPRQKKIGAINRKIHKAYSLPEKGVTR